MQISDVKPYEKNAKKHPEWHVKKIADSIRAFGCNQPIVVDGAGVLVAGHGRFEAMTKELGYTEMKQTARSKRGEAIIPFVVADDLSLDEIAAYRLADNQLNALTGFDMDDVKSELIEIDAAGIDIGLTGFDPSLIGETYDDYESGSLAKRFLVPPFSVLNTREGLWQARKRKWIEQGIQSELGRADDTMGEGLTTLSKKQSAEGGGLTGTSIFDPVLCELMYTWFAPNNAKVLDPFAGGSVRGAVASKLGHQYSGTELREEQVEANYQQSDDMELDPAPVWAHADALDIADQFPGEEFDMMLTCPPYADLEVYSDDPKDLSTMDYKQFVPVYSEIMKRATALLKENSFAVVVVGEVRGKNGEYYNFVGDTIQAMKDAGLHYYNEIMLVNAVGTLAMRITKQFTSGRKIGKSHQNVLVFWKGDPKNVKDTVASWDIQGDIFSTEDVEEGLQNTNG